MNEQIDEKLKRHIYRLWSAGVTTPSVAETYAVSLAEVEEILREEKGRRPKLEDMDAREVFQDHEIRLETLREGLAANSSRSDSTRERISAARAQFSVEIHLLQMRREAGILPSDLGYLKYETEMDAIIEKMRSVTKKHELGLEVMEDFADAFSSDQKRKP